VTRAERIADLLETALQPTGGEMVEGAFVDHWVPGTYDPAEARLAVHRLEELFRGSGFTEEDAGQIQAALSSHDTPHEAAAHLVARLRAFIGPLVERMLTDPDAGVRANGVRAAAVALPHERWMPLLTDPDGPQVREAVVRAMSRFRTPDIAAALFERLQVETDPDVRHALVLYEGFQVLDGAASALVDLMLRDPSPRIRRETAFRLEHFDAGVVPPLIEALRDQACVRAAAMSLGRVGDLRALPALIEAWSDPRNRHSARVIETALTDVAIRAAGAAPPPMPADLADRVRALLAAWEPADWVGRACKERDGLPLSGNQIYMWALRPDGEILCIDHESFTRHTEPETDPLTRFAMMVHGARKYPELRDTIPRPPADARPCDECSGTGARPGQESGCLSCGGRGWWSGG
jgi:HEAT repeat protein